MSNTKAEYFNKESLIKELTEFEQTAASINASSEYLAGVGAIIERLKRKEPDKTFPIK